LFVPPDIIISKTAIISVVACQFNNKTRCVLLNNLAMDSINEVMIKYEQIFYEINNFAQENTG